MKRTYFLIALIFAFFFLGLLFTITESKQEIFSGNSVGNWITLLLSLISIVLAIYFGLKAKKSE